MSVKSELILPIRRICRPRRAPETPGGPLALKDVLNLVSFLNLASCCENMNDNLFIIIIIIMSYSLFYPKRLTVHSGQGRTGHRENRKNSRWPGSCPTSIWPAALHLFVVVGC